MNKKDRLLKKHSELKEQEKQIAAQLQLLKRKEAAQSKKKEDRLKYMLGGCLLRNNSKLDLNRVVSLLDTKELEWVEKYFPSIVKFELEAPNE